MSTPKPVHTLSDEQRDRLLDLLREGRENELAARFRVSRYSLVRAAAGLNIRRGTLHLIRSELGLAS